MTISFKINKTKIGLDEKTYFIADIAANHDGNLNKAIDLIHNCAEAGANAAKFQHFQAETIVSDYGFKSLGRQQSHQSTWKKTVFDTYKDASLPIEWTKLLRAECDKAKIEFFTSPYSIELVSFVDKFVNVYKVGSGDVTWHEIVLHMAKKNKPILIATGASSLSEVEILIEKVKKVNKQICLMQCNTNYTADKDNLKFINLNVLKTYKKKFPEVVLGLSDHTHGHSTVLGAVAMGARVIEKHFTLDNELEGPDHKFSMNPKTWREMIDRTRELELALGDGNKKIEKNEAETVILQRRALRANLKLKKNHKLKNEDLIALRPCPKDAIQPYDLDKIIGRCLKNDLDYHQEIKWSDLE